MPHEFDGWYFRIFVRVLIQKIENQQYRNRKYGINSFDSQPSKIKLPNLTWTLAILQPMSIKSSIMSHSSEQPVSILIIKKIFNKLSCLEAGQMSILIQ